jgi:DNA-binding transcriptional LysR family regulator
MAKIELTDLICALVAGGQGVSILPRVSVAETAASDQVCVLPLVGPPISFHWCLVSSVRDEVGLPAQLQKLSRAATAALGNLLLGH